MAPAAELQAGDGIDTIGAPYGLIARQETTEGDYAEHVLGEPQDVVKDWLSDRHASQLGQLRAEVAKGVPWHIIQRRLPKERRADDMSEAALAITAAVQVEKVKRTVLTEIGLRRFDNPPFDQFAQSFLPEARSSTLPLSDAVVSEELAGRLRSTGGAPYKRIAGAAAPSQREELAWTIAKGRAEDLLMAVAARDVTRSELDAVAAEISQPGQPAERAGQASKDIRVIDAAGQRIPSTEFFSKRGSSPFTLEEWCALPTRPVIIPAGKPEKGSEGLAEFLFEGILYSKQVCDRNGQAVGLSPEKRQEYISKITHSIENGLPIIASEYMPLVAIGNPIKRNTQRAALAEVDVMRRLSEIAHAVELHYEPGMRWLIGNEAPAFQGPGFNLAGDYVAQFHEDCTAIMQQVDPEGRRLSMFDEADMLWGTPEREAQWKVYEAARTAELRTAYENPNHPDHASIARYINTYIYPMATCTDPYQFEVARELSVKQIAGVYAALKESTGSVIRGVGAVGEKPEAAQVLLPEQQALLTTLKAWALDLTFKYRVAMDSREVLPSFREVIPDYTLGHTMVTKREKMVLYPNSGRGAYFPAHGEPVLLRPKDSKQRTAVTVRPWWQIASQPERYLPMHTPGREEPLYFEEIN